MSGRKTIIGPAILQQQQKKEQGKASFLYHHSGILGILQQQQEKEQGEASFRDFPDIWNPREGIYAHEILARKRLGYVKETVSPFRVRLGEIAIIPEGKPHAEISETEEDFWIQIKSFHKFEKEEAPDLSEGLSFFNACYALTQVDLPERCPTLAEGRGRGEYDELVTECNQLKAENSNLARRLADAVRGRDEAVRAQVVSQAALTARTDGRLRMTESYEGIVRHVGRDDVIVLFEVDDDLVEHTYTRDQFVDSRMPEEGDRLAVYVHVAQLPPEESAEGTDKAMEGIDEQPRRRRNIGKGPRVF